MSKKNSESYFFDEEQFHKRYEKQSSREKKHRTASSKILSPTREYSDAKPGRVVSITGEGIRVHTEEGIQLCYLKGLFKKERGISKNLIAVGDLVQILPSQNLIVQIQDRYSVLSRKDITGQAQQLIAVNIDQVLITTSVVAPPLKPALLDRYLISAKKGNMSPIIVVNKIDLLKTHSADRAHYEAFLNAYDCLGIPILPVSAHESIGIDALCAVLKDKASAFAGQSGVGKSSLLNLAFGFSQKTKELTLKTEKGAHATTTSQLLEIPGGGFCIDTPGIRSFGIWDLQKSDLRSHFFEFLPSAESCRYPNCSHLNEPSCAVQEALLNNEISEIRFESYRTLMEELLYGSDNRSKRTKPT